MSISNITYKELKDLVVTYIQNNCYNINDSKFSSLPGTFKTGYRVTAYSKSEGPGYTTHAYVSIVESTAIAKVTNTVNTDLTNFLTAAGYTNLNLTIPVSEFIGFFNNIIS